VVLSGMDGAGKSSLALALADELMARGTPARVVWGRLGGSEAVALDRIGRPVKRLLRPRGTIGDPRATGDRSGRKTRDPRAAAGQWTPLSWTWVLLVALLSARRHRGTARLRRGGVAVVCDRWLTDALVDLEIRYGRHAAAEALLKRMVPRPDAGFLLEIDAGAAGKRKPGDQDSAVLARMEQAYAARTGDDLIRLDAGLPRDDLAAIAIRRLDAILTAS
jgi:thymidylate kinase